MNYKKHKQYRLPGFDYTGEGEYFVTICTKNKKKYFGKIENDKMILSDIGKIVERLWIEIPNKFDNIGLDAHQVMPDHFHGIIKIKPRGILIDQIHSNARNQKKNIINDVPTNDVQTFKSGIRNNPMELKSVSLGKVIRWFKGRTKYETQKLKIEFFWQPRFYDRIIRDEREHYFIREYIENNVLNYGSGKLEKYF